MGVWIDTVGFYVDNSGTTASEGLTDATAADGDSFTVRHFGQTGQAWLEGLFTQSGAAEQYRVLSPNLHDNVTGITVEPAAASSLYLLPPEAGEPLVTADKLTVQAGAAGSSYSVGALMNYYSDPNGPSARLKNWGDIKGSITHVKPLEVVITTDGTAGVWNDTVVNTTDKQLKAHRYYAVLGYRLTTAVCAVGIKGDSTSNYRVCGPGLVSQADTADFFQRMSMDTGRPHIPVFSADNQDSTYVSAIANTASVATHVYLELALLAPGFAG